MGRNGTGKSSFISVLVGETAPQLRHRGNVRLLGSFGYLPQAPIRGGLGLEPTGFSHVLSARGLDVLDDALGSAAPRHGRRSLRGEHRALHGPAGAVPVQRRLRGRGRHGPLGRGTGPPPGAAPRRHRRALGRPAAPGRHHAGALPGARADDPRRADQPPRPLGQALAPRRAGPLPRCTAGGEPRPQAARPVHHQGAAHLEPAHVRMEGQLLTLPVPARGRPGPARARLRARTARDHAPVDPGRFHAGEHREARPQGQGDRQAGRAAPVGAHAGRQAGALQRLQAPDAAAIGRHPARGGQAGHPLRQQRGAHRRDLPRRPGRPHRHHRPQRRRASLRCCAAWPGCRSPPTA